MTEGMTVHVSGLGFPEGPVALGDGRIAFVDLLGHDVSIYDGRRREVLATLPGAPNGMRLGPDGSLLIANNGGLAPLSADTLWEASPPISGRIQRLALDGALVDVATELPGPPPWRPNDLALAPGGEIVFSDSGNWEAFARHEHYRGGSLDVVDASGYVTKIADIPGFPNGVGFDAAGDLYVTQSRASQILKFGWPATPQSGKVWARLPGNVMPDGLLWHRGLMYVAGSFSDSVLVLNPKGEIIRSFDTGAGSHPTNVCIDEDRLWVTLGLTGQLVSFDLRLGAKRAEGGR